MLEWEWYNDVNTFRLFTHLLFKANWEDKKWCGVIVKRGEIITSLSTLAEQTGLTLQQVRTSISKLQSTNEITSKTTNKYSIISITNYNNYQDSNTQNNKQITNKQQAKSVTNEQQTQKCNKQITCSEANKSAGSGDLKNEEQQTNNKQITNKQQQLNNINNITNINDGISKKYPMPKDWVPDDFEGCCDFAEKLGMSIKDFDIEICKMRNYFLERPKIERAGWDRSFKKWLTTSINGFDNKIKQNQK
jgi:hypothetical protein